MDLKISEFDAIKNEMEDKCLVILVELVKHIDLKFYVICYNPFVVSAGEMAIFNPSPLLY